MSAIVPTPQIGQRPALSSGWLLTEWSYPRWVRSKPTDERARRRSCCRRLGLSDNEDGHVVIERGFLDELALDASGDLAGGEPGAC